MIYLIAFYRYGTGYDHSSWMQPNSTLKSRWRKRLAAEFADFIVGEEGNQMVGTWVSLSS
jgi:hypothetical protein